MQNISKMIMKSILTLSIKTVWFQRGNKWHIIPLLLYLRSCLKTEQYMAGNKVIRHLLIVYLLSVCKQCFVSLQCLDFKGTI